MNIFSRNSLAHCVITRFNISRFILIFALISILHDPEVVLADCTCLVRVSIASDSSGPSTIKKIKSASVSSTFGAIYIVGTYTTRWTGNKKINPGKGHTFSLSVPSNCEYGKRRFKVERKDGKTCQIDYGIGDIENYSVCGFNKKNSNRRAPTIFCAPEDWK